MHDPKTLDPIHREALDNVTGLLQAFMERQNKLRLMIKRKYPLVNCVNFGCVETERVNNKIIINYIRWVRYFLMGYSIPEVRLKTQNVISRWVWDINGSGIAIYPWSKEKLKLDDVQLIQFPQCGYLSYKSLVHQILDICVPPSPRGLFGLVDGNYGSITLDNAIELMKKEMREL